MSFLADDALCEIDASKVPPSRFQKREGSLLATGASRDGHTDKGHDRDKSFHQKLKEKVDLPLLKFVSLMGNPGMASPIAGTVYLEL